MDGTSNADAVAVACACCAGAAGSGFACACAWVPPSTNAQTREVTWVFLGNSSLGAVVVVGLCFCRRCWRCRRRLAGSCRLAIAAAGGVFLSVGRIGFGLVMRGVF